MDNQPQAAFPSRKVTVALGRQDLLGDLVLPESSRGVVLFAHGSGSSRHSPRNRGVAHVLHDAGFATLLIDLLTREEEVLDERSTEFRFDIGLLSERLIAAIDWLSDQ